MRIILKNNSTPVLVVIMRTILKRIVHMYCSVIMRIIINKLNIKNARQIGGQLLLVKAVEFAAMDCTWAGAIAVSSVRQITAILSAAVIT